MLARPAIAGRICRQCQRLATVPPSSRPALTSALVRLPCTTTPPPPCRARSFATDTRSNHDEAQYARPTEHDNAPKDLFDTEDAAVESSLHVTAETSPGPSSSSDDVPWYLQVDEPLPSVPARIDPLPKVPEDAHPILQPLLEYVYHEMGLDHLSLLDLRELETSTALGPNLIMVLGTARSERHLQVAGLRLTRWLRRDHLIPATASGLISPAEVKVKLRRLRKRAQLVGGSAGAAFEGKAHGLSTGWVVVNLGTLGENKGEKARLDEFGRLSGFGRVVDGTTIVVQCMTEKKRAQLDLEALWQGNLERHRKLLERLETGPGRFVRDDEKFPGIQDGGSSPLGRFRQQTRPYSTSTSAPADSNRGKPALADAAAPTTLAALTRRVLTTPAPVSRSEFAQLIRYVLTNPHSPLSENINIAESLFQAMSERGHDILSNDMLVSLITTMAPLAPCINQTNQPLQDDAAEDRTRALQRMQTSFETLLFESGLPCPSEEQLSQLLSAYGAQGNWPGFWKTFKTPMRFGKPRSADLYICMLGAAATSADRAVCTQALHATLPYMAAEEPPVALDRPLCLQILNCIAVADPAAFLQVADTWHELGFEVECKVAARDRGSARVSTRREFAVALANLREQWRFVLPG